MNEEIKTMTMSRDVAAHVNELLSTDGEVVECEVCRSLYFVDETAGCRNIETGKSHDVCRGCVKDYPHPEAIFYAYEVMIRATITKSVVVDAYSVKEAEEDAHQMFSDLCDGLDENYEQLSVKLK